MSTIKLKGSSSGEAGVTVAAAAGTPTFTLPTTVGSANQLLKNSGTAGTLEYSSNLTFDGNNLDVSGGCITTFGQNTTHEAASIKVGYEGSSKGQIRVYGADASTTGSLEFNVSEGDGTDEHIMLFNGSGNLGIGTSSPVTSAADYNGAALHLHQTNSSSAGSQIHLTTGAGGAAAGDGSIIAQYSDNDLYINNQENADINIFTNGNERARVTSDGYLFIGITSEPGQGNDGCRFGGGGYHIVARDTASSGVFRAFGGNGEFRVVGSGDCVNTNNAYGSLSDQTLKQDIVDASSQWNDIKQVKVRKFRFKDKPTDPLQIGVVAQELETISPGLVEDNPDELYTATDELPEGKNVGDVKEKGYKSVKYSVLYMKAVKALQEAMVKIETLETKVAALEAK